MKDAINPEAISKLIKSSKDDSELLEYIYAALKSFANYHAAVMEDQLFPLVYSDGGIDAEQYRSRRSSLDKRRTVAHNALIANVNLLNRMAAAADVEPIYDGVVSEESPYRRMLANAVFEYITYLLDRRT
ncbi:MAG: DUF3232 domain-containing protein [Oscillospiraceae bacterium]|nr:DUF3232 domain-containing protein [Oscillospiraceae bacterium]